MFWFIRLHRFIIALIFGAVTYGVATLVENEMHKAILQEGWAFLAWLSVMIWSFIEFRIKIPNHKSLHTNRHAFKAIREITKIISNKIKPFLGSKLLPLVDIRKGTDHGLGGSAKFAHVFDHWKHQYNQDRGDIFLGCSVWDHNCFVGQYDDKGGITFSEPRNGKGTSFIIPNLKLYQGSVLVLDGKNGENIDATGLDRENKGRVLCVDPYGMSKYGKKNGTVRFNPLAELDPNSDTIIDDLAILSDALVIKSGHAKEDHFADGGERLIKALIGHMISSHDNPNLADLRDLIMRVMGGDKDLLDEMAANMACHGIIQQAAVLFSENTTEIRNFISSAVKATEWLTKPIIREVLSASDFSFQDLKKYSGTSIYLVLDADTITINAPFLRLFVNIAVRSLRKGDKPKIPVLFLLDEFYSLGRMDQLSKNIDEIPGYGVKLWPVMHRIGQLKELYTENWDSFLGGTQVYFGLNQETAEYVETKMGQRGFDREDEKRDDRIYTSLLSAKEIIEITSNAKEAGNQIVLRADGSPLLLRRVPYYTSQFKQIKNKALSTYDPERSFFISDSVKEKIDFSVTAYGVVFDDQFHTIFSKIFKGNVIGLPSILDEPVFLYDGFSICVPSYCEKKAHIWSTNSGILIKEIDADNRDGYANQYLYRCGEGVIFGNSYNLYICNNNGGIQHILAKSALFPFDSFKGNNVSNIYVTQDSKTIVFLSNRGIIFLDRDSNCDNFEKLSTIDCWSNNLPPSYGDKFKIFENTNSRLSYILIYNLEESDSKELSTTLTGLILVSLEERKVVNTCTLTGIQDVCMHPNGSSLIVSGHELTLLSVPDLKIINSGTSLPADRNKSSTKTKGVTVICYSPCGKYLALSYSVNGDVEVRNTQTLDILYTFNGNGLSQAGMSWDVSGQYLACNFCRLDGEKYKATLMVWDSKLKETVLQTKSSYFPYGTAPVFRWAPTLSELACLVDKSRIKIFEFENSSFNESSSKASEQKEESSENKASSDTKSPEDNETDFALKVEAARKRWVLSETFTEEQVKERYPIILDNAGADEFEQVEKDFKILMQAAALFEKESRNITMPDGSIRQFTADKAFWNNMDYLIKSCDYTEERLVEITSIHAKEENISFEESIAEVTALFYRKNT